MRVKGYDSDVDDHIQGLAGDVFAGLIELDEIPGKARDTVKARVEAMQAAAAEAKAAEEKKKKKKKASK